MSNGARLFVTGASGFLGAHVVDAAARAGFEVVALAHRAPQPESLPERARRIELDLTRERELRALLDELAPAAIVNAAALARSADCERDPEHAARLNAGLPRALARWCTAHAARLVHVSTDLVFGREPAPPRGFGERDPPAPISVYGASKLAAETAIAELDPRAAIARLPLLLGPSHGRGLGATDSVLAAVDRGEAPALFEDEWRTPLDVRSAAEALVELAAADFAGILHVAGPERLSRHEIGLRALRRSGLRGDEARAKLLRTTRAAAGLADSRPADVSLDSSRARRALRTLLVGLESGAR